MVCVGRRRNRAVGAIAAPAPDARNRRRQESFMPTAASPTGNRRRAASRAQT
jgi:hypothetical protein